MKIIRAMWGSYGGTDRVTIRRSKMDEDIVELKKRPSHDFTAFTFGDENTYLLNKEGIKTFQCWDTPWKHDPIQETYCNKLYAITCAFEHFGEPILYLDWDCLPNRPSDIDELVFTQDISACLMMYKNGKAYWRPSERGIILNGGFLYISKPSIMEDIWKQYEKEKASNHLVNNDEPIIQHMIDDQYGGWMGKEVWLNTHEPQYCKMNKSGMFHKNNTIFTHYLGCRDRRFS